MYHLPVTAKEITDLIDQLPKPFILIGDMNAKHELWGTSNRDMNPRWEIFERILIGDDVCLLNDGSPTHFHVQTGSYSAIDLALCSSDCLLEFNFSTLDSLHDSDHYPILLNSTIPIDFTTAPERFNFKKADWTLFKTLTQVDTEEDPPDDIDAFLSNNSTDISCCLCCHPT